MVATEVGGNTPMVYRARRVEELPRFEMASLIFFPFFVLVVLSQTIVVQYQVCRSDRVNALDHDHDQNITCSAPPCGKTAELSA